MNNAIRQFFWFGLIASLLVFAWFLQTRFLINCDVSWDLLVTKRLLAGGTYTNNFFDLNPPLIFFEYIPIVFFEKFLFVTEESALKLYVFSLALISSGLCYFFMRRIFAKQDSRFISVFSIAILSIYLILSANEFGEREQLLLIFTLPWFLAVASRLQGDTFHPLLAVGLGLFAALGFALKPYFLVPFILVEGYYVLQTRSFTACMRIEMQVIILLIALYVASIFLFYPDYVFTVIPVASHFYYAGFNSPWKKVFINAPALFCYTALLFYFFHSNKNQYRTLKSIFLIAILGFLISYFLQQTNWAYHIYPALGAALLLSILLISIDVAHAQKIIVAAMLGASVVVFLVYYLTLHYVTGVESKLYFTPLKTFLETHAKNQPVYFITANGAATYPAASNANVQDASRWMHLFWMPGLQKYRLKETDPGFPQQQQYESRLMNMMLEDITSKKPKFILVDVSEIKNFYAFKRFEYLPYFLQNARFKEAFKPYHRVTTLVSRIDMLDQRGKNLYVIPDKNKINLAAIKDYAVILTGSGSAKVAYFAANKNFFSLHDDPLHVNVILTPEEENLLAGQSGLIQRNAKNEKLLDHIITKAIYFPFYQFDVYQRSDSESA